MAWHAVPIRLNYSGMAGRICERIIVDILNRRL
jgi:hypothetical protein